MDARDDGRLGGRRSARSRSRSPRAHRERRARRSPEDDGRRERRSERSERSRGERRHRSPRESRSEEVAKELPFGSRKLVKGDFEAFRPLLGYYLSIQKQKDVAKMQEREVKGRWKSFLAKWNAGTLAEGWYDPSIWELAVSQAKDAEGEEREWPESPRDTEHAPRRREPSEPRDLARADENEDDSDSNSDGDDIGAPLPPSHRGSGSARHTAPTPRLQDLRLRDELLQEEMAHDRSDRAAAARHARTADRREQKERLEELVPRAEPGSRERKLEKKKEVNAKMSEFRERSPGGEVDEGTLMGDGGGSLAEVKRLEALKAKKKTEREVRREEIWRARMAEREERVQEYREREEETVAMLKELARSTGRGGL
ncbi:related to RNA helicase HEL117 [Cephalotrichum gorgonifer]|uniref:Related to RNA helicase HEL117 n=1 Tax=Cephalotrichum gorgonifer TaxID=2041049 RepID=A0AAE8N559_9PEZI|nr:related to RNA helicase HEL117 [Cephalotrichum gorgonifer]